MDRNPQASHRAGAPGRNPHKLNMAHREHARAMEEVERAHYNHVARVQDAPTADAGNAAAQYEQALMKLRESHGAAVSAAHEHRQG